MDYFQKLLKDFFEKEEELLIENYPGLNFNRLYQEFLIQKGSPAAFMAAMREGIPLQYISGKSYFYKSEFSVNADVLIPRSETELLVDSILKKIKQPLRLADVGTGSGCIPLSIAADSEHPLEIVATDISSKALEVAKNNYFRLGHKINRETSVEFVETDRLKGVDGKFEIITSNPPYIHAQKDKELVHDQVHKFEPHIALYLTDDEYSVWFKEFFDMVIEKLSSGGTFFMEGHEKHLNDLAPLAEQSGLKDVKILPDLTGSHRFLSGLKIEG